MNTIAIRFFAIFFLLWTSVLCIIGVSENKAELN